MSIQSRNTCASIWRVLHQFHRILPAQSYSTGRLLLARYSLISPIFFYLHHPVAGPLRDRIRANSVSRWQALSKASPIEGVKQVFVRQKNTNEGYSVKQTSKQESRSWLRHFTYHTFHFAQAKQEGAWAWHPADKFFRAQFLFRRVKLTPEFWSSPLLAVGGVDLPLLTAGEAGAAVLPIAVLGFSPE